MTRRVRVFRPSVERGIRAQFGHEPPTTDAVRLLRAGQENTDVWLDARSASIGASEISILMLGEHPHHSRYSLFHVKRHGWGRHQTLPVQERGHWMEQGIGAKFADQRPDLVVARPNGALWADPQFRHMTCTPDFLTYSEDGLVIPLETKSDEGGDGWGWEDDAVPAHHWWQVQQQCGVFGAPYGYLARWNTRGYRLYTIDFQEDRYVASAGVAARFLADVQVGMEPEPDGHDTTAAVLRDLDLDADAAPVRVPRHWGDELDALAASKSEIVAQEKGIKNKIRAMMGTATSAYDLAGRTYTRSRMARKGYTVKAATVDKLDSTKPARGTL